jgi:AhpD family alkylhydroperoxidase
MVRLSGSKSTVARAVTLWERKGGLDDEESEARLPLRSRVVIHPLEVIGEIREPARELREQIPDVLAGYAAMQRAVLADGALPAKMKELIALAIAATRECDGCIAAHALGAARKGATPEEVAEAMGVVIQMNGGPGMVWAPRAYAAFREVAHEDPSG